jgi:hypothetical protein
MEALAVTASDPAAARWEGQLPVLLLDEALEEKILVTISPEISPRMQASG